MAIGNRTRARVRSAENKGFKFFELSKKKAGIRLITGYKAVKKQREGVEDVVYTSTSLNTVLEQIGV